QILEQRAVGLIGPAAIQTELRSWPDLPAIPSVSTIQRILKAAGLLPAPAPPPPLPYYPHPTPTPRYPIQAMDWTERYLPGGAKVRRLLYARVSPARLAGPHPRASPLCGGRALDASASAAPAGPGADYGRAGAFSAPGRRSRRDPATQ